MTGRSRLPANGRPGKIAVVPTKPLTNERDLSLAYSPRVAEPCLEIKKDPDLAYTSTAKGNLVAVVTRFTWKCPGYSRGGSREGNARAEAT
jgi:malic enzyme